MIRIFIFTTTLLLSVLNSDNSFNLIANSNEPELSFGVVTDVQYCNCDSAGTRFYNRSLIKLKEAVNTFNTKDLDFMISLGDLIDRDLVSFDPVLKILNEYKNPVYHTLGNHDFDVEDHLKENVYEILDVNKGYYSQEYGRYKLIVLNSNDISIYSPYQEQKDKASEMLTSLISGNAINAHDWNGGIGKEQRNWLLDELVEASNNQLKVIIFSHHPVWPQSTLNVLNYMEMLDIVSNFSNIIGWFSGHKHEGGYGNYNNTHHVNFRGMVETPNLNSYAVVEIYKDKIWIKAFGREKGQILAL